MKCLLDTGATACFIGLAMARKHGLVIQPSSLKTVATAAGKHVSILGAVTFKLQLGPALLECTAHVLPDLLSDVHLILGEEFMKNKTNNISLRYNPSRCTIFSDSQDEVVLKRSQTNQVVLTMGSGTGSDVESYDHPDIMTPAQAARAIKRNPHSVFVALIKPHFVASGIAMAHVGTDPPVHPVHPVTPVNSVTPVTPVPTDVTPDIGLIPSHLLGKSDIK
jgi:hypothetical protein